jgi:tRNA uridine 5-carbamoylmethylation protein Kti12
MIEKIASFDCVILRGLPGSGKSTFAKRLASEFGFVHLEADEHLYVNGEYRFDPARIADAHALVVRDACAHLQVGARVVVANTHVRLWEMAGIIGSATIAQRNWCIAEFNRRYDNKHAVPEDVISGMIARWERANDEWADRVFFLNSAA